MDRLLLELLANAVAAGVLPGGFYAALAVGVAIAFAFGLPAHGGGRLPHGPLRR